MRLLQTEATTAWISKGPCQADTEKPRWFSAQLGSPTVDILQTLLGDDVIRPLSCLISDVHDRQLAWRSTILNLVDTLYPLPGLGIQKIDTSPCGTSFRLDARRRVPRLSKQGMKEDHCDAPPLCYRKCGLYISDSIKLAYN